MFFSVDTHVFILLEGHYPHIPKPVTVIRKKKEKLCIGKSYNKLGPNRPDALLDSIPLRGVIILEDLRGKEASHFKAFMQDDNTLLDAFPAYRSTTEIRN